MNKQVTINKYDRFENLYTSTTGRYGEHIAFQHRDNKSWHTLSFNDLKQSVDELAMHLMAGGLSRGDRVVICSESRIEWPVFLYASWLCGATVIPVDHTITKEQFLSTIDFFQPDITALSPSIIKKYNFTTIEPEKVYVLDLNNKYDSHNSLCGLPFASDVKYRALGGSDLALISSTSSTSGETKYVKLSWQNLAHQISALGSYFNVGPEDKFLSVLPLNHMLELSCGLLTVFSKGSCVCYLNSILPDEIIRTSLSLDISYLVGVPMIAEALRHRLDTYKKKHADTIPPLKTLIIGGSQLSADSVKYFKLNDIDLIQGYGLTEASPVVTLNTNPGLKPESIGRPLPQVQIKYDLSKSSDENMGEILVKGPNVMLGYFNNDQLSAKTIDKGGWLHTGDIGYQDSEGYVYISGRSKNLIILPTGKNVSAEEVETCINQCHIVKEASVIGLNLEHELYKNAVEQIVAVVVISTGSKHPSSNNDFRKIIREHCKQLSPYKRPNHVLIYNGILPKTQTGKIRKNQVIEIAKNLYSKNIKR